MARKKNPLKNKVHNFGNWGIVGNADVAYSFEITGASQYNIAQPSFLPLATRQAWENMPLQIGAFKIVPIGPTNQLPYEIRDILEDNNLTEGVFRRLGGLLTGQGPALYTEEIIDGEKKRTWVQDPEVESWLRSFDYESQLEKLMVDYFHMEGLFAKFYRNLGARIGRKPFISRVEHVKFHRCRLEWPEDLENSKAVIVGDWYNPNIFGLKSYPMFDENNPFATPISMIFVNKYSFSRDHYGLPAYYGTLPWIARGGDIPKILEALTKNSLNIKWHIKSPASYWESKRSNLQTQCIQENVIFKEEMFVKLQEDIFNQLSEVLSGAKNVGKFFTSEKIYNDQGVAEEWSIDPIDQKTKDFIDSQLAVAKYADSAITSGLGIPPALANIIVEKNLSGGSEQLYAYKLHLATDTHIPERMICKPFNYAIASNWPEKNLKLGFFHSVVKAEENVSPPKRTKNAPQ